MMAQCSRSMSWKNENKKIQVSLKTVYFVYEVYMNATGCLNIIPWNLNIWLNRFLTLLNSTLKMGTACPTETFVSTYRTTLRHSQEGHNLNSYSGESLKICICKMRVTIASWLYLVSPAFHSVDLWGPPIIRLTSYVLVLVLILVLWLSFRLFYGAV
jgi:hypothetical protein